MEKQNERSGNDKSYQDPLDHLQRISSNKVNWIYRSQRSESVREKCVNMMHKISFFIVVCIFNKSFSFNASNGYRQPISREILFDICLIVMFSMMSKGKEKEEDIRRKEKMREYLPVWIYVCFFISDFWWKRLPQCAHEYGRVSEWINRCVDNVDERLKHLPHVLHWKHRSCVWVVRCWARDNEWPKVFGQRSHE